MFSLFNQLINFISTSIGPRLDFITAITIIVRQYLLAASLLLDLIWFIFKQCLILVYVYRWVFLNIIGVIFCIVLMFKLELFYSDSNSLSSIIICSRVFSFKSLKGISVQPKSKILDFYRNMSRITRIKRFFSQYCNMFQSVIKHSKWGLLIKGHKANPFLSFMGYASLVFSLALLTGVLNDLFNIIISTKNGLITDWVHTRSNLDSEKRFRIELLQMIIDLLDTQVQQCHKNLDSRQLVSGILEDRRALITDILSGILSERSDSLTSSKFQGNIPTLDLPFNKIKSWKNILIKYGFPPS